MPLDTSRQNPNMKTRYTNADLAPTDQPERSLAGLYDAAEQAAQEEETYRRLNAGRSEDPKDALVTAANKTLADTQTTAARFAHVDSDAAAAREQYRTEGRASPITPIADAAKTVGGVGMLANFLPGGQTIGLPSEVLYGLGSAAKAMDPYSHAGTGERLNEGLQAGFSAAPFAWRAAKGMNPGFPATVRGGSVSSEIPTSFSDKASSIPPVRHYWDALDLGQEPAKAAKIAAGRDKGALKALESLQGAGREARDSRFDQWATRMGIDHTVGPNNVPVKVLNAEENAAQDLLDKAYEEARNRGSRANSVPNLPNEISPRIANPVPSPDPRTLVDEAGRSLGNGEAPYKHAADLKYNWPKDMERNHKIAVDLLGDRVRTPAEMAAKSAQTLPKTVASPEPASLKGLEYLGSARQSAGRPNIGLYDQGVEVPLKEGAAQAEPLSELQPIFMREEPALVKPKSKVHPKKGSK